MNRRNFIKTISVAGATCALSGCSSLLRADPDNLPNIVFILADDLGYADLGCYGHPYARTPAIDRLAEEGTRFTQFYATGVTCSPSRTGLMTGLFPARFSKYPAEFGFNGRITITDLLKERGYRIGHFGKWNIGPSPGDAYSVDEYAAGSGEKKIPRGRDAWLFDEAIAFIEANAGQPFYVNIWGRVTHYRVDPHPDLVERFEDVVVNRDEFSMSMQRKFDQCLQLGGELDVAMRKYLADVYSLDMQVERVMKVIDELGLGENTLVVFSSDQGPAPVFLPLRTDADELSANNMGYAGELRGGKHRQHEGGVRVPFIVRWPGHVKKGRTDSHNVISGIDWMPTLCRIAGIRQVPERVDGEDVSDIWFGADRVRTRPLFWKTNTQGSVPSMREGRWKLHLNPKRRGGTELYDLSVDPSESRNVADRNPDVVAELSAKLKAWVAELPESYERDPVKEAERRRREESRRRGARP